MTEQRADEASDAEDEDATWDIEGNILRYDDISNERWQAGTDEAFKDVEGEDEVARAFAEHALDVRSAGVAGAFL